MGDYEQGSTPNSKVYVGGLQEHVSKEDLEREFSQYGTLTNVWLALNPPGYAFITFSEPGEAEEAIRGLNGQDVCGSRVKVALSRERRGGRGGGFRGGSRGIPRGGVGGWSGGFRPASSGYSSYSGGYGGGTSGYSTGGYGGAGGYRSAGYGGSY